MTKVFLTVYTLVWPLVVAGVLVTIVRAFVRELRAARRKGRSII